MKIETRNNGIRDYKIIIADEGKLLRRIEDGYESGTEISLGYSYYRFVNGEAVKRDEPLFELPEHYEEIDAPKDEADSNSNNP